MVTLTSEEREAVLIRCKQLVNMEQQHPGIVIDRCNATNNSNRRFFRKRFKADDNRVKNCIDYLEENGGFCNCEILFNVVPKLDLDIEVPEFHNWLDF